MAARSKASVCGRSLAGVVGSNLSGTWMSVCCECYVSSGRRLCDGPITRPEESYPVCACVCVCVCVCVSKCDHAASTVRRSWPTK